MKKVLQPRGLDALVNFCSLCKLETIYQIYPLLLKIQSNCSGSNIFETMEIVQDILDIIIAPDKETNGDNLGMSF